MSDSGFGRQDSSTVKRIARAIDKMTLPSLNLGYNARPPTPPTVDSFSHGHIGDPPPDLPVSPPVDVPDHELIRCLGTGGFGQVWLAWHPLGKHHHAVKLIPLSNRLELEGVQNLKRRVPVDASLLPIEYLGQVGDWLYVIMPYADDANGVSSLDPATYEPWTLAEHARRRGRLPTREAAGIGIEIAGALRHLHERGGVTHGDVKPDNVIRHAGRWKLADYGLVRNLSRPDGHQAGTPGYIPPEGPGTKEADQYALGVVLFELLTGERARKLDSFREKPIEEFKLDADAPRLAAVIKRATEDCPTDRFGSMREMEAKLQVIGHHGRVPRRVKVIAGLLVVLLIAVGLANWERLFPPASELAAEMHVDVIRYTDIHDESDPGSDLGDLTAKQICVQEGDAIRVSVSLSRPAYCYIFVADADGELSIPAGGASSGSVTSLTWPKSSDTGFTSTYALTDGPGAQAVVVLATRKPLADSRRVPRSWSPEALGGLWYFDGAAFRRRSEEDTRGEIVSHAGAPRPLVDLLDRIVGLPGPSAEKAVRLVAFEVAEPGS